MRALLRRVHHLLGHALVPRRLEPVRAHLVLVVALRLPALAHLLHKLGHLERALVAIPLVAGRAFVLGKLLALLAMLVHKTMWAFFRSKHLRVLLALAVLVFVAVWADVVGEAVAVLEALVCVRAPLVLVRALVHGKLEARPLQMLKAVRALLRRVHHLLGHTLVPRRLEPVRAHLVLVVALRLPALAHLLHKLGHLERALVAIPLVAGRALFVALLGAFVPLVGEVETMWAFFRSEHLRVLLTLAVLVF